MMINDYNIKVIGWIKWTKVLKSSIRVIFSMRKEGGSLTAGEGN